jgi:hypothetical protein
MTAEDKLAMPTTPELPPGTNMKLASEFLSIAFGIRKRHGYDSEKDYSMFGFWFPPSLP